MKKSWMKRAALVALAGVTAASIAACGGGGSSSGSKSAAAGKIPKDTIVVGIASDLASLDPGVNMDDTARQVTYPAYERLVKYKTKDGKASSEVEGDLAKSWTVSPDGLVWTFKLEKGHKFADGSEVTATAVKFTVDRVKALKKGPSDYFKMVKSVEAPDAETVVFTLEKPYAPFLYTLAVDSAGIVNPKIMDHAKDNDMGSDWLATHTMGSGPYELTEYTPSQRMVLTENKNYSGKKPAAKKVMFNIIKDPSAQRLQLESGDLDIAQDIPIDQIEILKNNKDIKVYEDPSMTASIVYLNCSKTPFNNKEFRQAISYAIDYDGVIAAAMKSHAEQLTTPIPKGMWGRDDSITGYKQDLTKAKELLEKSGVPDREITLLYSDNKPFNEAQALMIQNCLKQIGITLKLEKVAWATFRERVDKSDFQMGFGTWAPDYADPVWFTTYWFDSDYHGLTGNRSFYSNPEMDKLLREAEVSTDQAHRVELYKKVQQLAVEEAPYLFLFQTKAMHVTRAELKGFVYNPVMDYVACFPDLSK